MTQDERRRILIQELLKELPQYADMQIPTDQQEQKRLLRSLMNIRAPRSISRKILKLQDAYLQEEVQRKGITDSDLLPVSPVDSRLVLWRGDISL